MGQDINRKKIIQNAKIAKEYLKTLINNKLVILHAKKFDKYGRLLVDIYSQNDTNMSINAKMIQSGNGYEYHGGKKR